jgi:Family of unknown function (DUF6191)
MFNLLDELFVPGRRHTEDERNRLELSRDDEGSSDPARGAIDLDSGAVVVRAPRRAHPDADAAADADPDTAADINAAAEK